MTVGKTGEITSTSWTHGETEPRAKGWYVVMLCADDGDGRVDEWPSVDFFDGSRWKFHAWAISKYVDRAFSNKEWAEEVMWKMED